MSDSSISEIWKNRSLIRTFAINDLVIRYKSSALGILWSIIEPLLMLVILYVIFTHVFKSDIENYPLYLLLGIIMWSFFSRSTTIGINSLLSRAGIIKQVYFVPSITILVLPGILILLFVLALGISLFLSVLNVRFRDIQSVWGIVTYAGFFLTPVIYNIDVFPEDIQRILLINPVAQLLEMAHQTVLYGTLPSLENAGYTIGVIFGILILGFLTFRHYQFKVIEEL